MDVRHMSGSKNTYSAANSEKPSLNSKNMNLKELNATSISNKNNPKELTSTSHASSSLFPPSVCSSLAKPNQVEKLGSVKKLNYKDISALPNNHTVSPEKTKTSKKENSNAINSPSPVLKPLSPPSVCSLKSHQHKKNESLNKNCSKDISASRTYAARSGKTRLNNKKYSKEISISSHASKSLTQPSGFCSFKKPAQKEKPDSIKIKSNSKGLNASMTQILNYDSNTCTSSSEKNRPSKKIISKEIMSPPCASQSLTRPSVSSSLKKPTRIEKPESINKNNSKELSASPTYTAGPGKPWPNKKSNSKIRSSSYASRSLYPPSCSRNSKQPTQKEISGGIKNNNSLLSDATSYASASDKISPNFRETISNEISLRSCASCSLSSLSVSRSFMNPNNNTGSINKINSKEISSFTYTSCSLISLSVSSSMKNKDNPGLLKKKDSKLISGLYSDSWFSLNLSSVSCYWQKLKRCSSITDGILTSKVVLRPSQETTLDQKIYLRTVKRKTFAVCKMNKINIKENFLSQELGPGFIERFGSYTYAVSQTSITEILSRKCSKQSETHKTNSRNLIEMIVSCSKAVPQTLIPKIISRKNIETAASFYGPKMLNQKRKSRRLNQKLSSSTPSAFCCVTTNNAQLLRSFIPTGPLSYSYKSMNIFLIFYAVGFLLITFNQALVFLKFGWK